MAQRVKNPSAMWETRVWSLGQKDPLEEGMATHSSVLIWRIPWTEEPVGLQSLGSQRVRHNWSNLAHTHVNIKKEKEAWSSCSQSFCVAVERSDALLKVIAMGNMEPPESWFCVLFSTPASFLSHLLPQVGGHEPGHLLAHEPALPKVTDSGHPDLGWPGGNGVLAPFHFFFSWCFSPSNRGARHQREASPLSAAHREGGIHATTHGLRSQGRQWLGSVRSRHWHTHVQQGCSVQRAWSEGGSSTGSLPSGCCLPASPAWKLSNLTLSTFVQNYNFLKVFIFTHLIFASIMQRR